MSSHALLELQSIFNIDISSIFLSSVRYVQCLEPLPTSEEGGIIRNLIHPFTLFTHRQNKIDVSKIIYIKEKSKSIHGKENIDISINGRVGLRFYGLRFYYGFTVTVRFAKKNRNYGS